MLITETPSGASKKPLSQAIKLVERHLCETKTNTYCKPKVNQTKSTLFLQAESHIPYVMHNVVAVGLNTLLCTPSFRLLRLH